MRVSIGLVAAILPFCALGFTAQCGEPAKQHSAIDATVLGEFRIAAGAANPLMLPVSFADRRILAVLDTGSSVTVFDAALRPLLGTPSGFRRTITPNGERRIERFPAPELGIGRLRVGAGQNTVACSDLRTLREFCGKDIRLVIGMDVLKGRVVRIDRLSGKLSFLRQPPLEAAGAIPVKYFGGTPWVVGTVGTADSSWFQVDTGCCGDYCLGSLSKELFDNLRSRRSLVLLPGGGAATLSGTTAVRLGQLTLPLFISNYTCRSAIFAEESYCSLGLAFIYRYTVTLDFVNDRVYLDVATDPFSAFGLQTAWRHQELVVSSVVKGGRAERLGILEGDVITSLNGIAASEAEEQRLREEVDAIGKPHVLLIRRGHKPIEMSLAPLFTPLRASPMQTPVRVTR